jgi:DNA invertase Pin-like site-specific DNA recombinase
MISERTKAALAAAKARGVTLGSWKGGPKINGRLGAEAQQRQAQTFAADLEPIVGDLRRHGLSLRQMAAELTAQGIQTPRGGQWSARKALSLPAGDGRRPIGRPPDNLVESHLAGVAIGQTDNDHAEMHKVGDDRK